MVHSSPSSPSDIEEDGQRSAPAELTRGDRMAIGGESNCPHSPSVTDVLGIGAPLTFERCGRCDAVLVGRLGDGVE